MAAVDHEIRPLTPEDLALERDFVDSLSPASLRQRTLGGATRSDQQLAMLLGARQPRHPGVGCECGTGATHASLASRARFDPPRQTAEFAIIVADMARGQGIGTQSLRRLRT